MKSRVLYILPLLYITYYYYYYYYFRLVLTPDDSKQLTKELVSQVSASLRKIGRCVLDDVKTGVIGKSRPIECFNRYEPLTQLDYNNETVSTSLNSDVQNDRVNVDVDLVGRKAKAMVRNKRERKLRLATWNFSGLCSDRKQKEIVELLVKHNLDVVAGQESWEKEDTRIDVEGYKWFGKPRIKQNSPRGDGGVGFLVRECLVNEVEFINTLKNEESVWMKIRSERGREALYIGCVYMPTDSTSISVIWIVVMKGLKKMFLVLGRRERLFCWVISMPGLVDLHN